MKAIRGSIAVAEIIITSMVFPVVANFGLAIVEQLALAYDF